MRPVVALWPAAALALTFVDDAIAGPLLAVAGLWFGATLGLGLVVLAFAALVSVLCVTTAATLRRLDGSRVAPLRDALARARTRRYVGPLVDSVGDDRPLATAIVAMIVSPVFAVIAAWLAKPDQPLRRTTVVATLSYALVFCLAYTGGGAVIGSLL